MDVENHQSNDNEKSNSEETKRSIRVQTWKKFQKQKCAVPLTDVYNNIPNFKGSVEAASLLAQIDEFKNAEHIKVNLDRAQEPVKLEVIKAKKHLYVPPFKQDDIPAIFTEVLCPDDADSNTQKSYVRLRGPEDSRKDISIDTNIKLDMIVVGSCAVSRQGYRIGKGNGYVDLDFGLLMQLGVITDKTVVVTTVHEVQVYDELPETLFKSYDLPIDIIVTPKEIIRVTKRLPRPKGIEWNILSMRRVNLIPAIKALKDQEEKNGKIITLKEEDTDIESTKKNRHNRQRRQMRRRRNTGKKDSAEADTLSENGETNNKQNRRKRNVRRSEKEGDEEKKDGDGDDKKINNKKGQRNKQKRDSRDLCIKVSNIAKDVRIKDLKQELREHGCNPTFISWKGNFGKCYLHFAKKRDQDESKAAADILEALASLSLDVKCEVVIRGNTEGNSTENRIETTDVTSV